MRAKDYSVNMDGTLLNCCDDFIKECNDEVEEGDTITCPECGLVMILTARWDGELHWASYE